LNADSGFKLNTFLDLPESVFKQLQGAQESLEYGVPVADGLPPTLRCRKAFAAAAKVFGVVLLPTQSPRRNGVSPQMPTSSRRMDSQAQISAVAR